VNRRRRRSKSRRRREKKGAGGEEGRCVGGVGWAGRKGGETGGRGKAKGRRCRASNKGYLFRSVLRGYKRGLNPALVGF
jgi:hypothetical protein